MSRQTEENLGLPEEPFSNKQSPKKRRKGNVPGNNCSPRLPDRSPRDCLPSREEMLSLLLKGLPFFPRSPMQRIFEEKFRQAVSDGIRPHDDAKVCGTPMSYILSLLDSAVGNPLYEVSQLSSLSEMFGNKDANVESGTSGQSLREVYLMDVLLNRSTTPSACAPVAGEQKIHANHEIVPPMKCYNAAEYDDSIDYKFRTCLAFIPNAGFFTVQEIDGAMMWASTGH
jgi:hypothetical protein